jgi:hypothetical protein
MIYTITLRWANDPSAEIVRATRHEPAKVVRGARISEREVDVTADFREVQTFRRELRKAMDF